MVNTYIVTGFKDWSTLYWQGTFAIDKGKQHRHQKMIELCLQRLRGQLTVIGLERQYGFTSAMRDAIILYEAEQEIIKQFKIEKEYVLRK